MFWISILTGYGLGGLLSWFIVKINKPPVHNKVISKEKYVLERIKLYVLNKVKENKVIEASTLNYLVEQWEFDYEMDKLHKKH